LGSRKRTALAADLTPRFARGGYVPHVPHPPQQAFLLLSFVPEVFYGGAAGGGKSDAGLMAALQYVDVPGYSALIIRRTYADLSLPGAIMDRANDWLAGTGARKRDGGKLWEFPTNDPARPATLQFGYAQTHADVKRYQGAEFQAIFVDELTHFEERTYLYLFSRLRGPSGPCVGCGHPTSQPAGQPRQHDEGHDQCSCGHEHRPDEECPGSVLDPCGCRDYEPVGCDCVHADLDRGAYDPLGKPLFVPADDGTILADVPLRMRAGSNPGGVGHEWVKGRFVAPATRAPGAVFVPARLSDNPSLDRKAYRQSLGLLSETERRRLEDGDWDVADDGDLFERSWINIVDAVPHGCRWVRFWDMAATVQKPSKRHDPDWTVGALVGLAPDGRVFVGDVVRGRRTPLENERVIANTASQDGRSVAIRMEEEGGSSGKVTIDHYLRTVLPGYDFAGVRPTLSKEERARPLARAAEAGLLHFVSAPWNREALDEMAGFPNLPHDDIVDAIVGGHAALTEARRARIIA
jgi:predicted phage terminase large subunit-like protein